LYPTTAARVVGKGLPASAGAAVGKVVFTAQDAVLFQAKGEACILVQQDIGFDDLAGLQVLHCTALYCAVLRCTRSLSLFLLFLFLYGWFHC
jgi:hypothetical protein